MRAGNHGLHQAAHQLPKKLLSAACNGALEINSTHLPLTEQSWCAMNVYVGRQELEEGRGG